MSASGQDARIWTVAQVLKWTQERFAATGKRTPRLDAELLLAKVLTWPRVSLYTRHDHPLAADELSRYRELIRRRLAGEPVAYLTGQREFWSLTLRVTPAVLVPRPETEALVEVSLRLLDRRERTPAGDLQVHYDQIETEDWEQAAGAEAPAATAPPLQLEAPAPLVADVGTGSGALALALKKERPAARVIAVDVSEAALAVARDNAERLGLEIELLCGDLLAPLAPLGGFDLIVSNPPYIPSGELAGLPPEVRAEPRSALDGGPDGLAVIRRLVADARERLAPAGALALEVGDGQASAVAELLTRAGYTAVSIDEDLARVPRVVSGRRPD